MRACICYRTDKIYTLFIHIKNGLTVGKAPVRYHLIGQGSGILFNLFHRRHKLITIIDRLSNIHSYDHAIIGVRRNLDIIAGGESAVRLLHDSCLRVGGAGSDFVFGFSLRTGRTDLLELLKGLFHAFFSISDKSFSRFDAILFAGCLWTFFSQDLQLVLGHRQMSADLLLATKGIESRVSLDFSSVMHNPF